MCDVVTFFMPGGRGRQGDLLRNFLFNSERVPAIRGSPEHTSVAVPLLVRSHQHHAKVARWWDGQELALSGQALAETYSVNRTGWPVASAAKWSSSTASAHWAAVRWGGGVSWG